MRSHLDEIKCSKCARVGVIHHLHLHEEPSSHLSPWIFQMCEIIIVQLRELNCCIGMDLK